MAKDGHSLGLKTPRHFGHSEDTNKVAANDDLKQPTQARPGYEPTEEEIRQRAYEIYLARDERPGNEIEDWLNAEAELRQAHRIFQ